MALKPHILIIDDDHDVLTTIKDSLGDLDCIIESETNSSIALERIYNTAYDLVITDIMMPGVSGVEIAEAIRNTGRDTLVIVVTGFASIETAIKSIQYGVYDYIQKPLTTIKHIVENALEKLELQRNNKLLNLKVEEMLRKVSLLNEISSILYQVSDINEGTEMMLDTLTEGLKINRVGILLKDKDSKFVLVKHKKLVAGIVKNFKFNPDENINDQKISEIDVTIIENLENEIRISDNKIPVGKTYKKCVLIPITFHIKLLGYIVFFPDETESQSLNDTTDLLKIFSNQIAPIIFSSTENLKKQVDAEHRVSKIIEQKILEAKSSVAPISFALIRFVLLITPREEYMLDDYLAVSKEILKKKYESYCELEWLTNDTVLVSYSGIDLFTIEKTCFEISEQIEHLQISGDKNSVMSIRYACTNYPQVANSSRRLENSLWKNLFEELAKNNSVRKYL